ncbi:MAG: hypothetical protein EOM87_04515 [Clostridia bacterium]|nr:hypothetical protein [Clostridia bacterium]
MYKKILASVLALIFVFSSLILVSCKETGDDTSKEVSGQTSGDESVPSVLDDGKMYTFREYTSSNPQNWNPHTWETNGDSYIATYAEIGFVDAIYDSSKETFKWYFEMAKNIVDVTDTAATYGLNPADWGVGENTKGRIWLFTLNENAKWADEAGTVINADTYEYSLKALLDPEMQNYRANNFYSGDASIYGARSYFSGGVVTTYKALEDLGYEFAEDVEDDEVFVNMWGFWGLEGAVDADGNECPEFVSITDETLYRDAAVEDEEDEEAWVSGKYIFDTYLSETGAYSSYAASYLAIPQLSTGDGTWDKVGFKKIDDYSFIYITENTISQFYMNTAMTSNWIVYESLYEANKQTVGSLIVTSYGTTADNYMSFGPYKLTSFEKDKQLIFQRNENWYGYRDGYHPGQYQTDKIICDVIPEHTTQLMKFEAGELDSIELDANDMKNYKFAENLLKTDQTYTYKFFFATDKTVLQTLSANASSSSKSVNKVILSYDKFREAFSFAIDRGDYAQKGTAGQKPALGLINALYYYNVENDPESIYRKTDEAKKVIVDLYGAEYGEGKEYATLDDAYNRITGFDLDKAKTLFTEVYNEAKGENDLTDTDVFEFTCSVGANASLTEEQSTRQGLIQGYLDAATEGTPFAGKIKITFTTSAKRYDDVADGINEMAMGAWGGAAFYPFSLIRCYTDPDYAKIHEGCGFDPTTETVDIEINGAKVTKTYQAWAASIQPGGDYYDADGNYATMLKILAALEYSILKGYHLIVLTSDVVVSIYSDKVTYATTQYNIMYAYGGIRFMTFNHDDTDWAAYIANSENKAYS